MHIFIVCESVYYYGKIKEIEPLGKRLDLTKLRNAQPEIIWKVKNDRGYWKSVVSSSFLLSFNVSARSHGATAAVN